MTNTHARTHTHTHKHANNKLRHENLRQKTKQGIENYVIIVDKIEFTSLIVLLNKSTPANLKCD
jgi:hypothetical protein